MAELERLSAAAAAAKGLPPPPRAELDAALDVRASLRMSALLRGASAFALSDSIMHHVFVCARCVAQTMVDQNRLMLSEDRATIYLL